MTRLANAPLRQSSRLARLKHWRLGGRQDGVPRVGRDLLVATRVAHHIHRIEAILHPLDLLAQQMPQHRDPGVRGPEVFEGMHGDRSLALLRLEIVGLALAGLAYVRDDESIRDNTFRMALKPIAVRQVLDEVVTNSQRGLLKLDPRRALHQRSLELIAADHLVQYQKMPRIDDVLVVLQPIAVFDEADGIVA